LGAANSERISRSYPKSRLRLRNPRAGDGGTSTEMTRGLPARGLPPFGSLQADFYELTDGLRTGRPILLVPAPCVDFREHRTMPAHSDLSSGSGRFRATPGLFGNTN